MNQQPTTATSARPAGDVFSMEFVVLSDDDARVKDLQPGHIGADLTRFYVKESEWPALRDALMKQCGSVHRV